MTTSSARRPSKRHDPKMDTQDSWDLVSIFIGSGSQVGFPTTIRRIALNGQKLSNTCYCFWSKMITKDPCRTLPLWLPLEEWNGMEWDNSPSNYPSLNIQSIDFTSNAGPPSAASSPTEEGWLGWFCVNGRCNPQSSCSSYQSFAGCLPIVIH